MNIRKKFFSQFIILMVFFVVLGFGVITGFVTQGLEAKRYKEEIVTLKSQIKNIDDKIKRLENIETSQGMDLEQTVRQRLHMIKPNEIMYIVSE